MNAVNRLANSLFDLLLTPLELMGAEMALILTSGVIGIVALIAFKYISWQKGIKGTKDKIKGHMIAIRIYQDDLAVVFMSVVKVVLRNFQYLGLNFGPIVPLFAIFVPVMAQMVVRYAYDPLPVVESEEEIASMLPGSGTMIEVSMEKGSEGRVKDLILKLPDNFRALSPVVRNTTDGVAFVEVVATAAGTGEIELLVGEDVVGTKSIVAGDERERMMQPARVSSFWSSWLYPAESTFSAESGLSEVKFTYPDRELRMLPGGEIGVVLVFFIASILFGVAILKPLNIQI